MRQVRSDFRKRASIVALIAAAALLVAGVVISVIGERAYEQQKLDDVTVDGRMLASIVTGGLVRTDRAAAQEYLEALNADPDAEAAAIYDTDGALFASYRRAGSQDLPAGPPPEGAAFAGDHLTVAIAVMQDRSRLGTVYLRMVTEPFELRLGRYIGIGLLFTMAALLVGALGVAHSALGGAHAELERRAADLAAANRQLQAQIEEREKAEEALRQSQKMEAIGRLTGGVAHDFNNLLTIVSGNLDLMERLADTAADGGVPTERLHRLVEAAQRGLSRGERLTRQLLAFSRPEPLEARTVDINATIADFAPLIRRAIGETIDLRLRLGGGNWRCKLDPTQFETAILNLAINARDASEAGGALTITTGLASPQPFGAADRDPVAITVSDTGSGMSPETMRRIFEPFYTTKPVGKGSGFGLTQVWAFATQSAGRITAESELGKGTTFRLFLPLSAEAFEPFVEPSMRTGEGGSETILVVEDEAEVRQVTGAMLEGLGYKTLVARDGREALVMLRNRTDLDLLFTDYVMPNGLNGGELAREALRLRPELKVLVTSGYAHQGSASIDNSQVDGFPMIAKPYRAAELAGRIREVLDGLRAEPAHGKG
ncbi:MAG TPA: ATP-binding protein [Stellaceae bacterium]|jgi:signal transduction histidine kinase/ActR/RegA family two-component response regulator|nr:ATP-binding protein [Stellaceae bacterium]